MKEHTKLSDLQNELSKQPPLSLDTPPTIDVREELKKNEIHLRVAWEDPFLFPSPVIIASAEAVVQQMNAKQTSHLSESEALPSWAEGIAPKVLVHLATAYRSSHNESFALVAKEIYDCRLRRECFDNGYVPPKNPLAIPHRLGNTENVGWFGALPEFLDSKHFDKIFVAKIIENARQNLNHLCSSLHPARNIRMTQMDTLLTQGLRLRFLQDATRWQDVGLRGLNDCFFRQFNPDGSSIEATGWYHYIVANMALRFLRLKRVMPELGLQVNEQIVANAFDYTTATIAPDGTFNRIGDCTASVTPYKTLEAFLQHRATVRRELGFDSLLPPCKQFYPDAGQIILRESWNTDSAYITFDATRRMGYHWHPACNSIQLQVGKHRLIADPGRMRYDPTPQRKMAMSTQAHSTVTLNGWNQSESRGELTFKETDGYTITTGLYDGGYWPMQEMEHGKGLFASHHRTLLWIQNRCLIVIDSLHHTEGEGSKPTIESNWQFGQSRVTVDAKNHRVISDQGDAGLLMLFAKPTKDIQFFLHEGEKEPYLGWIADENDLPVPAPHLQAVLPKQDPWRTELVTVLIPFSNGKIPGVTLKEENNSLAHSSVKLQWDDGTLDTVLWTPRVETALESVAPIQTDAAMVHLHTGANKTVQSALIYEGTYLEPLLTKAKETRQTFTINNILQN